MEATTSEHKHHHHHYHIGLIILIILVVLVGLKLISRQAKWSTYVVQSQTAVRQLKTLNSIEDAGMIAATIVSVPQATPILTQPAALEAYIQKLSSQTGRDIVIVDNNKKIIADTVAANVGSTYKYDKGNEVGQTIADGLPRDFNETSVDYPSGMSQTVISFKNNKNAVVGAIIISSSKIF